MIYELRNAIHDQTDACFIGTRIYQSHVDIIKKKGWVIGSLTHGGIALAAIYTFATSFFLVEGSVRSLMEVRKQRRIYEKIRPFGDVGGWLGLSLLSNTTAGTFYMRFIRDVEYDRLPMMCVEWIREKRINFPQDIQFQDKLYEELIDILDSYYSQCFMSRSLVERRITALEIIGLEDDSEHQSELCLDMQMRRIFNEIKSELDEVSCKKYFSQIYLGQKSIVYAGEYSLFCKSLIMGIAIPILLLSFASLSYVGEVGLGKALYIDRKGLEDVGHFGEWPVNAIEMIALAFLFHKWSMIIEGDLIFTQNVYAKHIHNLRNNISLHNRMCDIANEELTQLANNRYFFRLTPKYNKFERL